MKRNNAIGIAASRIGVSLNEYERKVSLGLKCCTCCKDWHGRDQFNADRSRGDGFKAYCRGSARNRIDPQYKSIPGEEWRPVVGYEGIYEVSNLARIRKIKDEPGKKKAPYIVSQQRSHGYRRVVLCKDGCWSHLGVHQIVCPAFHGPMPQPGMEPNHKDGEPSNNAPSNLEWVTRSGNVQHALKMGLIRPLKGEDAPRAKLTDDDVRRIRELRGQVSQRELALRFGVTKTAIRYAQKGHNWRHL